MQYVSNIPGGYCQYIFKARPQSQNTGACMQAQRRENSRLATSVRAVAVWAEEKRNVVMLCGFFWLNLKAHSGFRIEGDAGKKRRMFCLTSR